MSVYFEEHVVTHEISHDENPVIHLVFSDGVSLCGSKELFHDPNCPGHMVPRQSEHEMACIYCGMPICETCIFLENLELEFDE